MLFLFLMPTLLLGLGNGNKVEDTKNTFRVKVNMNGVTPFTAAVLKLGQKRKFRSRATNFPGCFTGFISPLQH